MADWSKEKTSSLIKLFKTNECLYNPQNIFFKSKAKKNSVLAEISSILEVSVDQVKKKLNSLKTNFNAEKAKVSVLTIFILFSMFTNHVGMYLGRHNV